jgi:hypothetical protein
VTDPTTPPRFLAEPTTVIAEFVAATEPELTAEAIYTVIDKATPSRARQRELARALTDDPSLLVSGRPAGPRSVGRLIQVLLTVGAKHVRLPCCARCRKTNPLVHLDDCGQRICGPCYNNLRAAWEICGSCGRHDRIEFRDRNGVGRCKRCPPDAGHDHAAAICGHIDRASGGVTDLEHLRALVEQAVPQPFQRRSVSWELDARPELLTGQAAHGSPRLVALVDLLVQRDVSGIVAPACPFCDQQVILKFRRNGQRCCRRCYDEPRAEVCSSCGRSKQVTTRTLDGQPVCSSCTKNDPVNHESCTGCGCVRLIVHRDSEKMLCHACWRGHHAVCSICGQTRPCYFAFSDAPRCENCSRNLVYLRSCVRCGRDQPVWACDQNGNPLCGNCARRRAPCCRCGRTLPVKGSIPDGPICRGCYQTEPAYFQHCIQCGVFEHLHHYGLCERCACPPLLRQAVTGPDDQVRPELEPMIHVLLANDPHRLVIWLGKRGPRAVLAGLAAARGPVTHAALDQLAPEHSVARLRDMLVAAKFLPERDEHLVRLERWLDSKLTSLDDPAERKLLRGFVTWFHLRRQRRRSPITYNQASAVRTDVRSALALLSWLREQGLSLTTCTQGDIDTWLAEGNSSRLHARNFLAWAVRHSAAQDVVIPSRQPSYKRRVFPETDHRWKISRRLLHDDQLDDVDRVAGLLLLLFAQPLSQIARLTTSHVTHTDSGVQLNLGSAPLDVPYPLDKLLLCLVRNRRGHAVLGRTDDNPWLFPGGAPGRHLTPQQLMRRFQRLGIPARIGRNSALMDLASELPAPVISQLLGLTIRTATDWGSVAGNTHSRYAAQLARERRH